MLTKTSRMLFWVLPALVACGGQIMPETETVVFAPEVRTAGYGYIGGMAVTLIDSKTDDVKRTIKIQASDLSGTFRVEGGGVTVSFAEEPSTRTLVSTSGEVSLEFLPESSGSKGSEVEVHVHVDVLFVDSANDAREVHVVGDYDADLVYVG